MENIVAYMENLKNGEEKPDTETSHNLRSLGEGKMTKYQFDGIEPILLERFPNPFVDQVKNPNDVDGRLELTAPEFTSLCPVTGQPDFAEIVIHYTPDQWCVESKSLKLYLMSYRNVGDFHEQCTARICNDLVNLLLSLIHI